MIFKPMKKTIWVFAVLAAAGVLSACGSDAAAARSVKCDNCTETQIKALLGRDSQNANAGDNVVITLRMTGKEHDEVLAWIDDGGDMPSALCRENVYQAVAVHTSFIDTHRWAIVRNDTTLFADERQEHGAHLVGGYATLTLNPRAEAERVYKNAGAEIRAAHDVAMKSVKPVERPDQWGAAFTKFMQAKDEGRELDQDALDREHNASLANYEKAKADRKVAIDKANSVRSASIAEARRIRDAAFVAAQPIEKKQEQHRKNHVALSDSYQPGDTIRVLEQGDAPDSLKAGDYRVVLYGGVVGERLIAHPVALPNGEAANNCNTAPAVTQYYVSESGKYAWQAWR